MKIILVMNVITKPLPVLQLQAFERAAKHRSFTSAANEMGVQQPAISRQIAGLEDALGARLFERTKPKLTLTRQGKLLNEAVSRSFEDIRAAMADIRNEASSSVIVVNTAIGFASQFLLPRLAEFQASHPDCQVQLNTRDQNEGGDPNFTDVLVAFGNLDRIPDQNVIFRERMVAICAPDFLRQDITLSSLVQQKLLHMSSPEHTSDWTVFLEGTGVDADPPPMPDRIMSYMVYLMAVQNGQGIGIGWLQLVENLLANGSLRMAVDRIVETRRGYYAELTPRSRNNPAAHRFLQWLTEAGRTQT